MGKIYVAERENILGSSLIKNGDQFLRGMMISVNENGLSNDLRFESPGYLVEGKKHTTLANPSLLVSQLFEMKKLLEAERFDKGLTQNDINKAFSLFLEDDRWLNSHMQLFGFKKVGKEWVKGDSETELTEIYVPYRELVLRKQMKPSTLELGYQGMNKRK